MLWELQNKTAGTQHRGLTGPRSPAAAIDGCDPHRSQSQRWTWKTAIAEIVSTPRAPIRPRGLMPEHPRIRAMKQRAGHRVGALGAPPITN
jgi:hypothetical protein